VTLQALGGEIVTKSRLCYLAGRSRKQIDRWIVDGCPVVEAPANKGGEWKLSTAQVFAWLERRADQEEGKLDLEAERARLAKEQADSQALKNARLRAELLPAEEVESVWQSAAGRCRAILLGIPNSSAERIVLIARREEKADAAAKAVRELLTGQIDGALAEMARLEVEDDEDGADAPGEQVRAA
jgi:phage terminase Nu1 subunit (DNA packaging protein)